MAKKRRHADYKQRAIDVIKAHRQEIENLSAEDDSGAGEAEEASE